MLIAAVSGLPFYSLAQSETAPTRKSNAYTVASGKGVFILSAGPNGTTVCREATAVEAQAMRNGTSGAGEGLIQINHLKDENSAEAPNAGLKIVLKATDQLAANQAAVNAFTAAAAKWEAVIKDPITILVEVDYGPKFFGTDFTSSNIIGATESPQLYFDNNYSDVRNRLISHAALGSAERSLANSLPVGTLPTDRGNITTVLATTPALRALSAISASYVNDPAPPNDIPVPRIGFNSNYNFDLDPTNDISPGQTDFDAVAVHEMGHVLGFDSSVGSQPVAPAPLAVSIWDLFRFAPGAANLGNFGSAQRILSTGANPSVQHVQFNGAGELGLSTGDPEGNGGDGEQASHWKADEKSGNYLGIMDPTIAPGVREVMTVNDQKTIDYFGYTLTPVSAPPNDNFANAQTITGNSGTLSGTNRFATKETGEPNHSPDSVASGKSIWYRWVAPNSGTVTITTAGSSFDTLLAVYGGTTVGALGAAIAANDDENNPGGILTSRVQFSAVSGTTYQIVVDGYGGDEGDVTVNVSLPATLANTVQVSGATVATEADGATAKATVTITRTGTITGAATVNYATTDGTASERSDYLAALGTVRFAPNEGSKTITVFVVNDSFGESPETFNVTLNMAVGCNIGTPATIAVTINSDETGANNPNPFKDPTFSSDNFVRQQYADFFNREADSGGLNFWKNQIDECTTQSCREIRRINVSAAFFVSIEFQETGYLVYKAYQATYNSGEFLKLRDFLPDTQEIGRGVVIGQPGADAQLEANKVAFFNDFVQRPLFVSAANYPTTMPAAAFVDKLNANTFDPRNPGAGALTQGERDALVAVLTPNPSSAALRAQVLRSIAQNSLFTSRQFNKAFVLMQYFGYLRRNPNDAPEFSLDFGGYNFWLGKLNQFNGNYIDAEMVKAFITSGEYQQRFGP